MDRDAEREKKKPRSTSFRAAKTDGCSCFSITSVKSTREASKPTLNKNKKTKTQIGKCILDLGGFRMMKYMRRVFF